MKKNTKKATPATKELEVKAAETKAIETPAETPAPENVEVIETPAPTTPAVLQYGNHTLEVKAVSEEAREKIQIATSYFKADLELIVVKGKKESLMNITTEDGEKTRDISTLNEEETKKLEEYNKTIAILEEQIATIKATGFNEETSLKECDARICKFIARNITDGKVTLPRKMDGIKALRDAFDKYDLYRRTNTTSTTVTIDKKTKEAFAALRVELDKVIKSMISTRPVDVSGDIGKRWDKELFSDKIFNINARITENFALSMAAEQKRDTNTNNVYVGKKSNASLIKHLYLTAWYLLSGQKSIDNLDRKNGFTIEKKLSGETAEETKKRLLEEAGDMVGNTTDSEDTSDTSTNETIETSEKELETV